MKAGNHGDASPKQASFGRRSIDAVGAPRRQRCKSFNSAASSGTKPLERLALDAHNNRRNEPARLAHLDHGDDCAILPDGG
jgi:hypothetical protein